MEPTGLQLKEAKVAWIVPILGVMGNILYSRPMLSSLAAHCGSLRVFTPEFEGDTRGVGFEIERCGTFKRLYPNERLRDPGHEYYPGGFNVVTPGIIPALWRYRPDLIVVNEYGALTLYTILLRKFLPAARVLLVSESRPRIMQGRFMQFVRQALRTFIINNVDKIITNNIEGINYLTSELHAPLSKIIMSPYIVSDMSFVAGLNKSDLLSRCSHRGKEFPIKFLFSGQLLRRKGLQYALDAFAALLPQYQGKFVYDIVGDGPMKQVLTNQIHELGLAGHVRLHGRRPYEDMWQFYLDADVFLFPTLCDQRALAPFEALSMGLPIVASINDGGVCETVDPGKNGFSFDPRDTAALAKILARIIDHHELISEYSQRSMEMAASYTLESATANLVSACQKTLNVMDH